MAARPGRRAPASTATETWSSSMASGPAPALTKGDPATRSALVDAARAVFEDQGYLETRVADIVRKAGTSHGTFYTYFTDKESVFAAVVRSLRDEMMYTGLPHADSEHLARNPLEAIEASNRAYLRSYRHNAKIMAIIEQVSSFNEALRTVRHERTMAFVDRSAKNIRRLQKQGLADRTLDPDSTALALAGMVSKFAYLIFVQGENVEFEQGVQTLTQVWANAIGYRPAPPSNATPTS